MDDNIKKSLEHLRGYRDKHLEAGKSVVGKTGITILDIYLLAALHNSYCFLQGFCDLIESRHFIAASPFVRLQLANCLGVFALSLVSDPSSFAEKVIVDGKPIERMQGKERRGNKHLLTFS